MEIPQDLVEKAGAWPALKRWEKKVLGQDLRSLGLSYKEIRELIPVPPATLSGWCRDIVLTEEHMNRLKQIRPAESVRIEIGNRRRQANLQRVGAIRRSAMREGLALLDDPFWAAGVVAYWAEGAKRANKVVFSNSDPQLVSLFIRWSRCYLNVPILNGFAVDLHLHAGQDALAATGNWAELIGISLVDFRRHYIKPEGSGHRKNVLYNGTAQITIRKSTDHFHRIMGWIDAVQTLRSH